MSESIRALIVEDDFLVSEMIQGELEDRGHIVAGRALDGRQGLELTESLRPDVVLMDIKMPDMDGVEATRLIQERCPTPVVVLTAYDAADLLEQTSEIGVGAYLVKPPRGPELDRAMRVAIARFADLMEARNLNKALEKRNAELQTALATVRTLRGLLPICSSCKKIRDDEGDWRRIEEFLRDHSEAEFSHGICPDCLETLYPEFGDL